MTPNPVPAWKPGSFSAAATSVSAASRSRTFNFNNLPQGDTSHRVKRINGTRALVDNFKRKQA
ncbi:hypothetical protein AB0L82_17790 [Nocardia sp. NPDC052001]|uniref:hypothetical protein n=1 Tax=Nocardia sp. NPDC052001 TaxID=3154853 RepID=UPI0034139ECD